MVGEGLLFVQEKVWLKWSNKKALAGIVIKINLYKMKCYHAEPW